MESIGPDEIDSALCAGLKDPRERTALFRLEQWYVEFCNTTSLWMDVGGAYNRVVVMGPAASGEDPMAGRTPQPTHMTGYQTSFHRLLVHRLADRFGIRRESRGTTCIRLLKCSETRIPEVLVQNLDPNIYYPADAAEGNDGSNHNGFGAPEDRAGDMNGNTPSPSEQKQQKKKIIMKKRNVQLQKRPQLHTQHSQSSDNSSNDNNSNGAAKSSELEAREKAYAEARARIFNEGEEGKEGDATGEGSSEAASDSPPGDENVPVPSMSNLSIQDTNNGALDANSKTLDTSDVTAEISPSSAAAMEADRKAVYRNRATEAADPDFQRGRIRAVAPSGPAAYNNPYYPPHSHPHQPPPSAAGPYPAPAPPVVAANIVHKSSSSPALNTSAAAFVPGATGPPYPKNGKNNNGGKVPPAPVWGSPNGSPRKNGSKNPPMRYNSNPEHQRGYRPYYQQPPYPYQQQHQHYQQPPPQQYPQQRYYQAQPQYPYPQHASQQHQRYHHAGNPNSAARYNNRTSPSSTPSTTSVPPPPPPASNAPSTNTANQSAPVVNPT